uniref:ATP-dependent Clp protease proteolytic subunit n=1 Tax=Characiochloris acuminata TaxID=167768 RepID=A0A0S2LQ61_9CHLO|nr:proteolytic subunit 2 of clp protease [Characiochloris acuminata]ALO63272.1 proteolytic subunit 2 of clp protease [Characiochloris acuminata]
MPIGVPRIIYCWGEELPAQWTDIYNFIFRRRMVFLMQYLDDELCNQICGLLINIHMEDRSKELEKKEIERSGLFKSGTKQQTNTGTSGRGSSNSPTLRASTKTRSVEDLLSGDEDLGIEENDTLEQYTLQKITMEWLNWNAQFFDYSDEPYLFYLAELLSKDFSGQLLYNGDKQEISRLMYMFRNMHKKTNDLFFSECDFCKSAASSDLDVAYGPFRYLANSLRSSSLRSPISSSHPLFSSRNNNLIPLRGLSFKNSNLMRGDLKERNGGASAINKLINELAISQIEQKSKNHQAITSSSEKVLGQRRLRREYKGREAVGAYGSEFQKNQMLNLSSFNYLEANPNQSYSEYRDLYRKQTERTFQEEESKKVFVIINSFGGSVGNGITVHDALQFIKAGSLTLALGVAASAASLALAGGTIGERYVTEGCHVMIHQPESGLQGQASDIWIDSLEIMRIRQDVASIYSLSTYRPRHKILRDLDRDFYLNATETIYYGLADEIATNEVMHEILEMTNKAWSYDDSKQQRLLESRESASAGLDTQTQS